MAPFSFLQTHTPSLARIGKRSALFKPLPTLIVAILYPHGDPLETDESFEILYPPLLRCVSLGGKREQRMKEDRLSLSFFLFLLVYPFVVALHVCRCLLRVICSPSSSLFVDFGLWREGGQTLKQKDNTTLTT